MRPPKLLLNNNFSGKPEDIYLFLGGPPQAAFGNSTGDRQMLEYAQRAGSTTLMMLVLHDDGKREYAYGPAQRLPATQVGTFTQGLYDEAKSRGLDRDQHEERLEARFSLSRSKLQSSDDGGLRPDDNSRIAHGSKDSMGNRVLRLAVLMALAGLLVFANLGHAQQQKPNILVIMGDDVGYWNLSTYNQGMMGYRTPNLDRLANEGVKFTDGYAENSCTAGRSAFITGQSPFRTGLLKVGLPGAKEGLSDKDPTIANLLKPMGYMTGQFGKNHLGDRNEFLPTVHGFDEFFGNLYHLNAEEEPEHEDYPKNPQFKQRYGPRGVLHCFATDVDDPTVDPRFGAMGKQKCEDTGPLTKKRMETVDEEFLKGTLDFIDRSNKAGKPFFVWFNTTLMHIWTHLPPQWKGKTGLGVYPDGMLELDSIAGQLLKKLEDLGIANNTIVIFTTDNGAEVMTWPDGGTIPFRGEKNTTWEGGFRVPMLVRWPGHIKAGMLANDPISLQDWLPTLTAAAGAPDIKEKLLDGYSAGGKTYKVHLDGYNFLPYLTGGDGERSPEGILLLYRRRRPVGIEIR